MKNIYLFAVAAIILSLGSCTIEKRHYQSGYHVEWNHRSKAIDKAEAEGVTQPEQESVAQQESVETEESLPEVAGAEQSTIQTTDGTVGNELTAELNDVPVITKQTSTQKLTERATESTSVSAEENYRANTSENKSDSGESKQVEDILLILLCLLLPPLAVYLYESDLSTNFWVDLLLTCLVWVPGVVFAFLVCFAGVSL